MPNFSGFGSMDTRQQLAKRAGGYPELLQDITSARYGRPNNEISNELVEMEKPDLVKLDRFTEGRVMSDKLPLLMRMAPGADSLGMLLAGGYEGAKKYAPGLLNALSNVPGFSDFRMDKTTSPADFNNIQPFAEGYATGHPLRKLLMSTFSR